MDCRRPASSENHNAWQISLSTGGPDKSEELQDGCRGQRFCELLDHYTYDVSRYVVHLQDDVDDALAAQYRGEE